MTMNTFSYCQIPDIGKISLFPISQIHILIDIIESFEVLYSYFMFYAFGLPLTDIHYDYSPAKHISS